MARRWHLTRMIKTLALFAAASGLAAQVTVQIPAARDNTLYQSSSGALSGALCTGLFVGVTDQNNNALRRALVYFDVVANLPAGAHVLSAGLSIQVTQHNSNVTITAHRALQDWGEGTSNPPGQGGAGTAATAGDATWLHTFLPGSTWTTAGGDFAAAPSLTLAAPSPGPAQAVSTLAAVGDVQRWLDDPAQNFGWLLKTNEAAPQTALRFNSREANNNPPTLTVTYLANGMTTTHGQGCIVGGQEFRHDWSAAPIGGTSVLLRQIGGPASTLAANLMSLTYDRVGTPITACNLYLPFGGLVVTHSILTLDGNGAGATAVNLPPGFPGVMFTTQTAALFANAAGFVLSNGAIALLQ